MPSYIGTATNLLGVVRCAILDSSGAVLVAATSAGITQPVSGSYEYSIPSYSTTQKIGYRWDEGTAATTVTDWVDPLPDNSTAQLIRKILTNKTVETDTGVMVYDDDGVTLLGTWTWNNITRTRGKLT